MPHVWYTDWGFRYLPIVDYLSRISSDVKILEVGSGNYGLGLFIPNVIVGVDLSFDTSVFQKNVRRVIASVTHIPFRPESYDVVVSLDTIEHLSPTDRRLAVRQILRLVKPGGAALIAFPCDTAAYQVDTDLASYAQKRNWRISWLEEHMLHPYPTTEEFKSILAEASAYLSQQFRTKTFKTTNVLLQQWYMLLLLKTSDADDYLFKRTILKASVPILRRFNVGNCYRRLFILERPA